VRCAQISVGLHDGESLIWLTVDTTVVLVCPCGTAIVSGYCPDDVIMLVAYGAHPALECHRVAGLIYEGLWTTG